MAIRSPKSRSTSNLDVQSIIHNMSIQDIRIGEIK